MNKRHRRLGALALGATLLAGTATAGAQQQSSKVTVAIKANENNLTPFTLTLLGLPVSHDLTNLVYDTLFWSQVKADPEPWLASSAEPNEDRTQWTVKLRPGVSWHDGVPFTAEDVKFTFEKMKATTGGRYSHHVWEYPVFKQAEVLDPLTVRLTFEQSAPTFKILPGADLPMVPKHIWESIPDASRPRTSSRSAPAPTRWRRSSPTRSTGSRPTPAISRAAPRSTPSTCPS
jgi:ABC-type transport system substrate-binding protein